MIITPLVLFYKHCIDFRHPYFSRFTSARNRVNHWIDITEFNMECATKYKNRNYSHFNSKSSIIRSNKIKRIL